MRMSVLWALPSPNILLDRTIATVDGQIILQSELEAIYQQYVWQGEGEVPNLKCKLLEQLILNKMLLAAAVQEKVSVDAKEVTYVLDSKMQELLEQTGSEENLVQYWGKPIEAIQSELKEVLEEQLLLRKMRDRIERDISGTPKEVSAFFEALPMQERPFYPTEVVLRQIVKYPQVSPQAKDTLIAQLKLLKVRLQNGEDFKDLAQEYVQDLASISQVDLGLRRLGELDTAYETAALALQPGELSDPVVTPSGFYLIQLVVREKDRYHSRCILLKPNVEALDIAGVRAQLTQLRANVLKGKLTFEQAAIDTSEDQATATNGGLLTAKNGSIRIAVDDLPPDIYFIIDEMAPGAVADPMLFTTAEGRTAVRILTLEEKIAPHQANLALDYTKIQQLYMDEKRVAALQKWGERAKESTKVTIIPDYQCCDLFIE